MTRKRTPSSEARPARAVYSAERQGQALALAPDAIGLSFGTWEDDDAPSPIVGGVALIDVEGPLEHRAGGWWESYDAIATRFAEALTNDDAKSIVMRIDSPGGAVSGLFETVRSLRSMKEETGKPVIAYVDEGAYSAAYALASVADEIYLPPSGGVGSVGVITSMIDVTKANADAGVRVEVITSGARKADGNPDVPLTDAAIARTQARVDGLAAQFFDVVASSRAMSAGDVRALEAGAFYGQSAVDAGLADGVMSLDDVLDAATRLSSGSAARASQPYGDSMKKKIAAQKAVSDAEKALAAAKDTKGRKTATAALDRARGELAAVIAEEAGTPAPDAEDDDADDVAEDEGEEGDEAVEASAGAYTKDRLLAACRRITGKRSIAEVLGALEGMSLSAKTTGERLAKLEAAAKRDKVEALIAEGTRAGKLTPAQREWAVDLGPKRLAAFLECAPVVVATKADGGSRVAVIPTDGSPKVSSNLEKTAKLLGVNAEKAAALPIVNGTFTPERAPKAH